MSFPSESDRPCGDSLGALAWLFAPDECDIMAGQTIHRYIQGQRLDRARQLLEQQAGNVSEVAYRVGFRDPRHFARLFQQKYG